MHGAELNDRQVATASDGGPAALARVADADTRDAAGLLAAQVAALARHLTGDTAGLWITLTPPADAGMPGRLLGQLRDAGHHVQGFVDRTALLAAWLPHDAGLTVLDMSRRQFSLGLAGRDAATASLRRHMPVSGGEQALHDAWLQLAAATLVQQTRFDPLHDLRHETALRARLPQLAADAQRDGQAQCEVDTGNGTATLVLTRDQFAAAAQPVFAPLAAALQALAAAHGDATLLVPAALPGLPGSEALLAAAHFARLHTGEEGLAARAASLLPPSGASAEGGVPWRTQLPVLAASAPAAALQPVAFARPEARTMATHVVWRGRVLPIPAAGMVIGREPGAAPALQLPEGIAGLSRRHCTLRRDGARAQVIDHSSHGTWIDGARVRGRALLPAGATLRLGDPGIELPLVAIDAE